MSKGRMEAFSDGVLAIIITIMVLKLNTPRSISFRAIVDMLPTLVAYVLSYIYIGIYWVNHHHLVSKLKNISGLLLWKNLHWIFWMSLIPMATEWVGNNPYTKIPALFYGFILLMCAVSYYRLQTDIIKQQHAEENDDAKSKDTKAKLSISLYALGMILSMIYPIAGYIIYGIIAILWFVPDGNVGDMLWSKSNQK